MTEALELAGRLEREVLAPLKARFVDKDEIVDLLGVCLVGGENLFILGPPGTAKSAIAHELAARIEGRAFDYLLTRFSEPNELFGPFDIRRLREGDLVTNTEGMLPEASIVFLDELLNANSAILNSLLMVLNERVFRRGKETIPLPLLIAIGASNRLPEDDALAALFDRFLLRVRCDNVSSDRVDRVLDAGWELEASPTNGAASVSTEDVRRVQSAIPGVSLEPSRAAYVELIRRIRGAGIALSDRRAVKLQRLIAASALLCGRLESDLSDLWVLRSIWDREEQVEVLRGIVDETLRGSAASGARRHPLSVPDDSPDAEILARDLEAISTALESRPEAPARARLEDRLGALASRCQWVADEGQRDHLEREIDRLFRRCAEVGKS